MFHLHIYWYCYRYDSRRCSDMATGTQLLKRLVNERLEAAAVEILGLVENTISEYQEELLRSRREIIELKEQLEQLTDVKPEIILFTAGL